MLQVIYNYLLWKQQQKKSLGLELFCYAYRHRAWGRCMLTHGIWHWRSLYSFSPGPLSLCRLFPVSLWPHLSFSISSLCHPGRTYCLGCVLIHTGAKTNSVEWRVPGCQTRWRMVTSGQALRTSHTAANLPFVWLTDILSILFWYILHTTVLWQWFLEEEIAERQEHSKEFSRKWSSI